MILHFIRFLLGYFFGSLAWLIILNPYKKYYDFTLGYYWPQVAFSLAVCLLFMASLSARTTMALFLPNMIGGATQNYIIMLLLTALVMNPLANVGFNSVESARVIGCSLTLTFDQLSERAKLVASPILEILNDKNQTDLDPIRQDLIQIQQFVGQLRQNAQLAGAPAPGHQTPIGRTNPSQPPPPPHQQRPQAQVNRDLISSKTGIQLEWDVENFGVKANVDMERLRGLAKSGKLQQILGHDLSKGMNLTELLYTSCLNIFESAKRECSNSINGLYASCKNTIGPYLATWWCAPFSYSLDAFCPWIMDQLVNEKTICKQIRIVDQSGDVHGRRQAIKLGDNRTVDVDEAFSELGRQIARLNQHILSDESSPLGAAQQANRAANRFEIHLTFNEKTRQIFQATKSVIAFISDKYKMRRLLVKALLLAYDLYTTYTFLLILVRAWRYQKHYLANIRFDNCYITSDFKRLDEAMRLGKVKGMGRSVLPLSRDEERHYISTFACRRRTNEERQVQRLSLTIAAIFLTFTLSLFYLDNIFYSLLASIHDHSLVRFKELGHHELDVRVQGDGVIGRLVRKLAGHLNTAYDLNRYTSTRQCLPESQRTSFKFYLYFSTLVALYFLIDQISIYAMRLRHTTCAAFYPDKQRQRVEFLHKLIQFKRHRSRVSELDVSYTFNDEKDEN